MFCFFRKYIYLKKVYSALVGICKGFSGFVLNSDRILYSHFAVSPPVLTWFEFVIIAAFAFWLDDRLDSLTQYKNIPNLKIMKDSLVF